MLPEDIPGTRQIVLPHDILAPGAELMPADLFAPVPPVDELAARRRRPAAAEGEKPDTNREAATYKLGGLR